MSGHRRIIMGPRFSAPMNLAIADIADTTIAESASCAKTDRMT
jgi:hypothetical protein